MNSAHSKPTQTRPISSKPVASSVKTPTVLTTCSTVPHPTFQCEFVEIQSRL